MKKRIVVLKVGLEKKAVLSMTCCASGGMAKFATPSTT
jgi:hypothetical protein